MSTALCNTTVTFPAGATTGTARIRALRDLPDGMGVITDETCFHPLDHTWPDQPADVGTITVRGDTWEVVDCRTAAMPAGSDEVLIGDAIPARRGDPAWMWLAVHVVDVPAEVVHGWEGELAYLQVDAARRTRLSAAHTACHLMALALNQALAGRWRKDVARDSLGHPDFDALAITSSRISETHSVDTYRLGKSLRKKGFTTAETPEAPSLADDLDHIGTAVQSQLDAWLAADAPVRVEADDAQLTAVRSWVCDLPAGIARLRCGGTHLTRLGELSEIGVELTLNEPGDELTVVTIPQLAIPV